MTIIPSGKTRVMVAQVISNPMSAGYNDGISQTEPLEQENKTMLNEPSIENMQNANSIDNVDSLVQKDKESTLSDFIFKTLESFGYPGRRLEEFKKKFVKETISPDGTKDIEIEMPDRHYPDKMGNIKTVENDELSRIIQQINEKFHLNFNGAKRSEGKWTINLTSAKKSEDESESGIIQDNLDEVYGTPSGNKSLNSKKEKKANVVPSQQELIKAAKNNFIRNFKK